MANVIETTVASAELIALELTGKARKGETIETQKGFVDFEKGRWTMGGKRVSAAEAVAAIDEQAAIEVVEMELAGQGTLATDDLVTNASAFVKDEGIEVEERQSEIEELLDETVWSLQHPESASMTDEEITDVAAFLKDVNKTAIERMADVISIETAADLLDRAPGRVKHMLQDGLLPKVKYEGANKRLINGTSRKAVEALIAARADKKAATVARQSAKKADGAAAPRNYVYTLVLDEEQLAFLREAGFNPTRKNGAAK